MKTNSALAIAIVIFACAFCQNGWSQTLTLNSHSLACVNLCNDNNSTTLTSSASVGSSGADSASAHTGTVFTHPISIFPVFSVIAGDSGVAVSATPGHENTAQADWNDIWSCPPNLSQCVPLVPGSSLGPWHFQWVLHLHGVLDPLLVAPPTSPPDPSFFALNLTYGDGLQGYQLSLDVCYDSGPCSSNTSSITAHLTTPAGTQDLSSMLVFGTNTMGQPIVDLDVKLPVAECFAVLHLSQCTWVDTFHARADVQNSGSVTHFMDFSGTFDASVISLDPGLSWISAGGRNGPPSPALVTYTGQYQPPVTPSSDPANAAINDIKNGRVIPIKVQLSQAGTAITDQNAPGPVTIAVSGPVACSSASGDGAADFADAGQSNGGTNQYRFDVTSQTWIYNLDTRPLGLAVGNCYRIDTEVNGTAVKNSFVVIRPTM